MQQQGGAVDESNDVVFPVVGVEEICIVRKCGAGSLCLDLDKAGRESMMQLIAQQQPPRPQAGYFCPHT